MTLTAKQLENLQDRIVRDARRAIADYAMDLVQFGADETTIRTLAARRGEIASAVVRAILERHTIRERPPRRRRRSRP